MSLDRKIDLTNLSEADFMSVLATVSSEVLSIGQDAESKINALLSRFNIKCLISLEYHVTDSHGQLLSHLPETTTTTEPVKKKRTRKKKL